MRFLEQGNDGPDAVNAYDMHEYKVPDARARGGAFTKRFTCFKDTAFGNPNAQCPGCSAGLPIKVRAAYNLIQRERPILRKDKDGKVIKNPDGSYIVDGYADEVVFWEVANTTANMIRQKDNKYHGLMSRDLAIGLSGDSFQPYTVEPADIDSGPQAMSDEDRALAARKKNLDEVFAPSSVQEAAQIVAKYGANSGANSTAQGIPSAVSGAQTNPMMAGVQLPPGAAISGGAFAAAQQSNE